MSSFPDSEKVAAVVHQPGQLSGAAKLPAGQLTPMMRQYLEVKAQVPDAILLFRLGDFYEMFFEDAVEAARLLDITLTSRSKGEDRVPMCGVPFHAAKGYVARLVGAGRRVAICDQVEGVNPDAGASHSNSHSKMMRRELTRVVTPGMAVDDELLSPHASRRVAAVGRLDGSLAVAFLDLSTGQLKAAAVANERQLLDELWRGAPSELVLPEGVAAALFAALEVPVQVRPAVQALDAAVGEARPSGAVGAACAQLLAYARETQRQALPHVDRLEVYAPQDLLLLDESTRRNLEITRTLRDGETKGSLLWAIDRTATAMGGRLLVEWLLSPLLDLSRIAERHDAVGELLGQAVLRQDLKGALSGVRDLERLAGKLALGQGGPRDLASLSQSLLRLPELYGLLAPLRSGRFVALREQFGGLEGLSALLAGALADEVPLAVKDGGLARPGHSPAIDELRALARDGKSILAALEAQERKATGISSLKIRYNRVFGYFIEVTAANLSLVPDHYVRRQTIAGGERFVTEELKLHEEKILTAEERLLALEAALFEALRAAVVRELSRLRSAAAAVAEIDVLCCFAQVANDHGYVRPTLDESDVLEIRDGRHPVVERMLGREPFVPNDLLLDRQQRQVLILTGPNMAGKSTVLRQAALIVLLAQAGSFVPARSARVGRCDRIFTRVGASDNLSRGQSTFMVEMSETAQILSSATARSLVVLDEIGRGTSTFDGLSIAWAVAEDLHDRIGARTLFATHYHELQDLCRDRPRVRSASMLAREVDGGVVFLRKVAEGVAGRSFGIEVARLAGLPEGVLRRAREILLNLESGELDEAGHPTLAKVGRKARPAPAAQLTLFAPVTPSPIEIEIRAQEIGALTPLQALNLIAGWQEKLKA